MADGIVIRAEGLGKGYLIGHRAEPARYTALRDVLARGCHMTSARCVGQNNWGKG